MSACRTATGPISGDGLLGLTRAFFAAGARSVVATLWDLPDAAAATMLPRFYREWQATGSRAEGLRRAQLAYLADLRAGKVVVTSPLGKTTLPEHPALWASLVLQGRP
jgi:CHAT domain-containing protein